MQAREPANAGLPLVALMSLAAQGSIRHQNLVTEGVDLSRLRKFSPGSSPYTWTLKPMFPEHIHGSLLLCLTIAASVAHGQHRSDIFLKNWNLTGAEKFRVDGVTSLVPPSLVDKEAIEAFEATVAEANGNDRIVVGRIPFDYRIAIYEEYARQQGLNLEDHICRSIEGDLISHPNGNIFLCSNSPFIRAVMKQLVDICSEAGCDWISADLQTATHDSLKLGGCFCRHCEAGFAAFLKKPKTWSYRDFLVGRGYDTTTQIKRQAWKTEASTMPFYREYRAFQHFSLRDCYNAIRNEKKFLTSHDFHGHSAPLGTHTDFDSVGEAIQRSDNAKIPLLYLLTDAADRFNYITEGPEGQWENFAVGRLRLCQAYAYGASWVVPYEQGIKRDGRWSRVSPPVEDLYTFIREHPELFDGYGSWCSVGLVYSHLGHRHRAVVSENAVAHLVRNNVPFRLCIAGSDWWEPEFRLSGVEALVKTSDYQYLTAAQESAVRKSGQAVVDISSLDQLWEHLDRPIQVSIGNDRINVVARRNQRKRLLHLVNMQPGTEHRDFKLILSARFVGPVQSANLYAPGRDPIEPFCQSADRFVEIHVPYLKEWGIVTLQANDGSNGEPAPSKPFPAKLPQEKPE